MHERACWKVVLLWVKWRVDCPCLASHHSFLYHLPLLSICNGHVESERSVEIPSPFRRRLRRCSEYYEDDQAFAASTSELVTILVGPSAVEREQ